MYVRVLGSAAGGGFPQWNCNCKNCAGFRAGTMNAKGRTQSSIAISSDEENWLLINASPDILTQIKSFPKLQPNRSVRDTAIVGVLLVDAQIDHVTGLLMLREGCPYDVYCTPQVNEDLSHGLPIFETLKSWNGGLNINQINAQEQIPFTVKNIEGLEFTAVPLSSNAPPYSPHRDQPEDGDNIGLLIRDIHRNQTLFYAPGVGKVEPNLERAIEQADCVLIDGTVWTNNEMSLNKVGDKLGTDMGHLPINDKGGMIELLTPLNARKILIHINNTNPILDEDSEERKQLDAHDIEVAYDGMDIAL